MSPSAIGKLVLIVLFGFLAWRIVEYVRSPDGGVVVRRVQPELPVATDAQISEALTPLQTKWAATAREVVRINLEDARHDTPWISKVGGAPYLEVGKSTPVTEDGKPMVLLAQINFAEMPRLEGYPHQGLLQFFIVAHDERYIYGMDIEARSIEGLMHQHSFRTRYIAEPTEDPTRLQVVKPPRSTGWTPHETDRPKRMRFEKSTERITPPDVDFETTLGIDPYAWAEQHAARLGVDLFDFAERAFQSGGGHKIGGYPYFTQTDPRPANGKLRLLLQLDSTDEFMMWGDTGVGAFFIDPTNLARADFSRVLYNWDNH